MKRLYKIVYCTTVGLQFKTVTFNGTLEEAKAYAIAHTTRHYDFLGIQAGHEWVYQS